LHPYAVLLNANIYYYKDLYMNDIGKYAAI